MGAAILGFYSLAFGTVHQLHVSALCQEVQGTSFQRWEMKGTKQSRQLKMKGRQLIPVRVTGLTDHDLVQKMLLTVAIQVLKIWFSQLEVMYQKRRLSPYRILCSNKNAFWTQLLVLFSRQRNQEATGKFSLLWALLQDAATWSGSCVCLDSWLRKKKRISALLKLLCKRTIWSVSDAAVSPSCQPASPGAACTYVMVYMGPI